MSPDLPRGLRQAVGDRHRAAIAAPSPRAGPRIRRFHDLATPAASARRCGQRRYFGADLPVQKPDDQHLERRRRASAPGHGDPGRAGHPDAAEPACGPSGSGAGGGRDVGGQASAQELAGSSAAISARCRCSSARHSGHPRRQRPDRDRVASRMARPLSSEKAAAVGAPPPPQRLARGSDERRAAL